MQAQKRDKIFVGIYSSYLQVNRSISPERRTHSTAKAERESRSGKKGMDAEYERELTPMLRRRNPPTAELEARENSGKREKK